MTQLISRQIILAKIEVTQGTDSAPVVATNALVVSNLVVEKVLKINPRNVIKSTLAPLQGVQSVNSGKITFDVEMRGSGAAGTLPEYDACMQACGLSSTVVAATSVTYKPISSGYSSCTIYAYQDGSLFKFTGCLGTYTIDIKSGGIGIIKFTFEGHVESHTDVAFPTGAVYSAIVPPAALSCAVSIGAYDPILSMFTYNSGVKVEMPESIAATDGYANFIIGARDGKGTLDVESTTIAGFDFYGAFSAGTDYLFTLPLGTTAGNIMTITHPVFYLENITQKNTGGILTLGLSYGAVESTPAADDEIKIVLT